MNQSSLHSLRPLLILFIVLSGFFVAGKNLLENWGFNRDVLLMGNLLLLLLTIFSFWLLQRGMKASNPQAFVRAVYGSFIIKFFVIAIAAFVYIMIAKKEVNKPALFTCMGLYLVYTFIEVSILTRLLKQKKNA